MPFSVSLKMSNQSRRRRAIVSAFVESFVESSVRLLLAVSLGFLVSEPALAQDVDAHAVAGDPVVVLIPGFFNTAIPGELKLSEGYIPYFSRKIIDTVRARATVAVVDTLLPTGTLETNGVLLEKFLSATVARYPGRKFIAIAHSAGGLYLMRALTLRPDLPFKTVVTIATPYTGVEFIDKLADNIPGLDALAHYLHLDILREFRRDNMASILGRVSVPDHIRWISIAGYQPSCFLWTCGESSHLSWLLTVAQQLMEHESDGIVTVDSALGRGAAIQSRSGRPLHLEPWADFIVPLEHWEIVQDYRFFRSLGVIDVGNVRDLQEQVFNELLDRLGPVELLAERTKL